jgi:hypothetical protein
VVAAPIVTGHPIGLRSGILIIIVTVVLAALSKKFVEDPFLRGRPASGTRWKTFALAGAAMASVIVVSVGGMLAIDVRVAQAASEREQAVSGECFGAKALLAACSNPRAVPPDLDTAFASTDYADTTLADCGRGTTIGTIGDSFECSFGDLEADQVVVVIGDSHAGHWIPALQRIGDQQDWRLVSMVRSSCPFTDVTPSEQGIYLQQCEDWKKDVYKRVEELQPDLVFVASLSPNGYLAAGFDPGTPAEMEEGYETSLARLAQTSAVIVLKDTPFMGTNMPDCLGAVAGGGDSCNRDRAEALDQNTDPLWEAAARIENVARVDLSSVFCDASTCFAVTGGVSIYRDHHHLSASFSASLAPQLETALLDQGVSLSSR